MRILMATALAAATTLAGAAVAPTAAFAQNGSYQASCRNVQTLPSGYIGAECADTTGRYRYSRLQYTACQGDIGNNNGVLNCNGASPQIGDYVTPPVQQPPQANNRDRDRNRNDNVGVAVGAGALGAIAGAFLGSNLYQGQYDYPAYGQRGYGDPRYDPRYAQGGYGYGMNGQFVPISRRVDWLDRRIQRGLDQRTLSRREAADLRDDLDDLVDLERRYGRNGFTNWERGDLDRRFDDLAARIRFEIRDNNNRPGYGDPRYDNRPGNDPRYDNRYGR